MVAPSEAPGGLADGIAADPALDGQRAGGGARTRPPSTPAMLKSHFGFVAQAELYER
jgi:hypothetical protein